jgi:hypothetical protein
MKSAHLPLVVTAPYAASLREKALSLAAKAKLAASASAATTAQQDALSMMDVDATPSAGALSASESKSDDASAAESPLLWILQRQVRAALIRQHLTNSTAVTATTPTQLNAANIHPPIALGPTNYVTELLAYRNFYRNRKQNRRDVKAWEKEDRRRRLELEDKRKKKALEYHKALLAHREDFFRFHKSKKFGKFIPSVALFIERKALQPVLTNCSRPTAHVLTLGKPCLSRLCYCIDISQSAARQRAR